MLQFSHLKYEDDNSAQSSKCWEDKYVPTHIHMYRYMYMCVCVHIQMCVHMKMIIGPQEALSKHRQDYKFCFSLCLLVCIPCILLFSSSVFHLSLESN